MLITLKTQNMQLLCVCCPFFQQADVWVALTCDLTFFSCCHQIPFGVPLCYHFKAFHHLCLEQLLPVVKQASGGSRFDLCRCWLLICLLRFQFTLFSAYTVQIRPSCCITNHIRITSIFFIHLKSKRKFFGPLGKNKKSKLMKSWL